MIASMSCQPGSNSLFDPLMSMTHWNVTSPSKSLSDPLILILLFECTAPPKKLTDPESSRGSEAPQLSSIVKIA